MHANHLHCCDDLLRIILSRSHTILAMKSRSRQCCMAAASEDWSGSHRGGRDADLDVEHPIGSFVEEAVVSVGRPVGQAEGNSGIGAQVQPSLLQHQRQHLHLHIASPFSSGYCYCPKQSLPLLQAHESNKAVTCICT